MDRSGLIARAALVATACLSGPLLAHPHAEVEQQALVSIAQDQVTVTYHLAASKEDGAHMFDHLDSNGDGRIGQAEGRAFGHALLRSTALSVNGRQRPLTLRLFAVPDRQSMAAGMGVVRVQASAALPASNSRRHALSMSVSYRTFAHEWFIQPFVESGARTARHRIIVLRPSPSEIQLGF